MSREGWVKLYRKLINDPIIKKHKHFAVWVILLLTANHKDNKFIWNNEAMLIKEGQLIAGRGVLGKVSGISETHIERILKYLEKEQCITQSKNRNFRLITIVNWKDHQVIHRIHRKKGDKKVI